MQASSWAISGFIALLLMAVGLWGWGAAMNWMVPLFAVYTVAWIIGMIAVDWIRERK